ncbi:cyclin-F-like [Acipenser oxyrinchus oxyrinchus]|uniref:Cyclin-F n=1 Tax=Acipenser oxyrinchus oxyrinchus TaxID=40147 RepID=A0AAD8D868_ACIOX|nr:cyclin-F-like [Acipenser oxyrinchus oxyrinchus]
MQVLSLSSVLHCRCSKCFSLPAKRRFRKRAPALSLLSLPEEVLLCVLKCLSAQDLPAVRAVHSRLRDIIDSHTSVWANVRFQDVWPMPDNLWLFERAAESRNFEAAVKLGIAYLYNEGPSVSDEGRAEVCGLKASRFFSLAESLRAPADPFVWLFIRPPWSPSGSCCKAVVFESLRAECQANPGKKASLLYCLARVLQLFDDEQKHSEALTMLEESSSHGCLQSSYLLWESKRRAAMGDPGRYLQCLRTLRDYAAKGSWEAQLALAKACLNGNQLGLEAKACSDLVSQIFQSSCPLPKQGMFTLQKGMNDTMRYILVDWLVEVTTMKDFSSLSLHVTVGCVDRYLLLRSVPKARLQLLGIACMVICTRYTSKEILTIREAVWLTDNTYKYEDLVRMMGEVISALEGKIRTPTLLDYGEVLLSLSPLDRRSENLLHYICELSLLYTRLSQYSPARLAAAALLLTRILHRHANPWPSHLSECTGYSLQDLVDCVLSLHKKCFHDDVPKDYRHVSLTGVTQRFEDDCYQQISKEKVLEFSELCVILEVKEDELSAAQPLVTPSANTADMHTFLSSPASKNKRRREDGLREDRDSFVATPTAELSNQEETLLGNFLDWSLDTSCSGYEGDRESEGEKEGEVTAPCAVLDLVFEDGEQHCRAQSSEDESPSKEGGSSSRTCGVLFWSLGDPPADLSSGYSSVNSGSPPSSASALGKPLGVSPLASPPAAQRHGHRWSLKRKNAAEHSGEEMNTGSLSV